MGFLKKLKKVIKKIDPIGSKIADKTNKVVAKVASKDPITSKLLKIDPMMKNNALGRALRGFNPMAEGLAEQVNARINPQAPVAPPVAPAATPVPAPDMGMAAAAPPMAPMGAAPMAPPSPMGNTGVMPPAMGAPAPMGAPAARGAALRGFGGGGNRRMGGGY